MPWLPLYIDKTDVGFLSAWLNGEPELAIIQSLGDGRWRASEGISITESGRYCLFHKSSGPLPLIAEMPNLVDGVVKNPFEGWQEKRSGRDPDTPYFGAGHPAIFWLNVRLGGSSEIGLSSFEWIGNHYSVLNGPAPDGANKWWARLKRWVKKNSTRIPRQGSIEGNLKEIYAFESALQRITNGLARTKNP